LCPVLESNLRLTHLLPSKKGMKLDSDYSGSAPNTMATAKKGGAKAAAKKGGAKKAAAKKGGAKKR